MAVGAGTPQSLGLEAERGADRGREVTPPLPTTLLPSPASSSQSQMNGAWLSTTLCSSSAASAGGHLNLPTSRNRKTLCHLPCSQLFWVSSLQLR